MSPSNRNTPQASHTTTILFFVLILVAFFPGIFHYLWTLPLALLTAATPPITNSDPSAATAPNVAMGSWYQKQFTLPSRSRGSYLITDTVVGSLPEISDYKIGLLNLFIQHTSCALSLNENWDDDVRADMSDALDRIAPESGPKGQELYRHSAGKRLDQIHTPRPVCERYMLMYASLQRGLMTCLPTSSPRSSARLSRYRSEMESWRQVRERALSLILVTNMLRRVYQAHGRASGIWSFEQASIRGRSSQPFREKRRRDGHAHQPFMNSIAVFAYDRRLQPNALCCPCPYSPYFDSSSLLPCENPCQPCALEEPFAIFTWYLMSLHDDSSSFRETKTTPGLDFLPVLVVVLDSESFHCPHLVVFVFAFERARRSMCF